MTARTTRKPAQPADEHQCRDWLARMAYPWAQCSKCGLIWRCPHRSVTPVSEEFARCDDCGADDFPLRDPYHDETRGLGCCLTVGAMRNKQEDEK